MAKNDYRTWDGKPNEKDDSSNIDKLGGEVVKLSKEVTDLNDTSQKFFDSAATKEDLSGVEEKFSAGIDEVKDDLTKFKATFGDSDLGIKGADEGYSNKDSGLAKFAMHVREAGLAHRGIGTTPDTLTQYASGNVNVRIDSEGGFLIPKEQIPRLLQITVDESPILSKMEQIPVSGNTAMIPALDITDLDKDTISAGVTVARIAEGGTITASQPAFAMIELKLNKIAGLVPVTNEMLSDSPVTVSAMINNLFGRALRIRHEWEAINGNGAGMFLGMLNATCKETVAKATGQAAATIVADNIPDMWKQRYAELQEGYVWIANQDIESELAEMSFPVGTGGSLVYQPMNGLAGRPFDTLYGKEIIFSEYTSALGTEGDLILVNLSQFLLAMKGESFAESVHLYFDSDRTAYRITARSDAQPWWKSSLTPANNSSFNRSIVLTLATRS